jgi:diguanylate cyclase (GGDEF)-like protein
MDNHSRSQGLLMSQDVETLQAQFDSLIQMAKNNERKQLNFQEYELSLLNCSDLLELFSIILEQHKEKFQLTEVTILLHDPEYEFRRLLESRTSPPPWRKRLIFKENIQSIRQYFTLQRKPRLSEFSLHQHQHLFLDNDTLRSVALLPLVRQNQLIGSLNLGSRAPDRFQANIGTQFLQHLAAVVSACIENARLKEQIKQVGLRDPLTGVNNRRFFDQRINEEVNRAQRNKSPLSCLFIDLDHFKRVNDDHGHQAGDSMLKQTAHILDDSMRTSDVLARYGGEEFVCLLADTSNSDAYDFAERIREKIAKTDFQVTTSTTLNMTLSIGLATLEPNSAIQDSKQLIHTADQAVYAAKVSGRNRVHKAK